MTNRPIKTTQTTSTSADSSPLELKFDRAKRAKIAEWIRHDDRLTKSEILVALSLMFDFMGALGRACPGYETLAKRAQVAPRTAKSAIQKLVDLGYITKTRRYGPKPIKRDGRWMPDCLTNMYTWCESWIVSAKNALRPKDSKNTTEKIQPPTIDQGLSSALQRLCNAMIDQMGSRPAVATG